MVLVFHRFHCNTYLFNMRRARIKALAAVPVRKKPLQDSADCIDANDPADKEKKIENVSNTNETEQEFIKEVVKIKEQKEENLVTTDILERKGQKEKDISNTDISKLKELKKENDTDILKQEAVKDIAKDQEETTKKKQNNISLKETVIIKKSDSPQKPSSQELYAQTKFNFQESPYIKVKPDKLTDQSVQKSILLPDVPTAIDIGKNQVTRIKN